jgi:hypothetical protein
LVGLAGDLAIVIIFGRLSIKLPFEFHPVNHALMAGPKQIEKI